MEQAVRHAAQEQTRDGALSTRADNDQVRAGVLRGVGNRVGSASCGGPHLLVARVETGVFQILDLVLNLALDFLLVDLHRVSTSTTHGDLLYMQPDVARGAFVCKPPGTFEGPIRVLGPSLAQTMFLNMTAS